MSAILPGATIGVIGGGQLARMLGFEAKRMGYRLAVLDPDPDCPAASLSDVFVPGALDDPNGADRFARHCDVVTLDTEHVSIALLERIEASVPVRPGPNVLQTIQDRATQRAFLASIGAPQPTHALVSDPTSLRQAVAHVGAPCILKTRRSGYDGRGQVRIAAAGDADRAWRQLDQAPAVAETVIDFEREISVLVARDPGGDMSAYPIADNQHRRGILHATRVPATIDAALARTAEQLAMGIAQALGHIGVLAVELFVTRDGALLVNEIAPRTHNSGHFSFGACATSQFEQHVRAICGLPLGDTSLLRPAVMLNLLGDLWQPSAPAWSDLLAAPGVSLHLYGKRGARPGRKMGHLLVVETGTHPAHELASVLERQLSCPHSSED